MDGSSIGMIVAMVALILMSGFFSATETAFSSLNRIRVKNLIAQGHKRYELVLKLSEKYDTLLSTILIGNNIVNILCTSIATVFFVKHWGDFGVTLSTIVITIVVLIFGEVSPKTVAKEKAEAFAAFSAPVLQLFMWILMPVNAFFIVWKKLLTKVFHLHGDSGFTEEELITIVDEVQSDGVIDQHEGELIRSAIEFNDLNAADILTPRVDIIGVEVNASFEEVEAVFQEYSYTRLPVYEKDMDHIVGILHEKDFNRSYREGGSSLSKLVKTPVTVSEGIKIPTLLRLLQYKKSHMAIVVDEFGGTAGLVSLEDVLEELVGEIWDEHDEVTEDIHKNEDDTYTIHCATSLDKLRELFPQIQDDVRVNTVGGWVMHQLGKLPQEGDTFSYENLTVTVTKVDFRRAVEIRILAAPTFTAENDNDRIKETKSDKQIPFGSKK